MENFYDIASMQQGWTPNSALQSLRGCKSLLQFSEPSFRDLR